MQYHYHTAGASRVSQNTALGVVMISLLLLVFGILSSFSGGAPTTAAEAREPTPPLQAMLATPTPIIIIATPTAGAALVSAPAHQEDRIRIVVVTATPPPQPTEAPALVAQDAPLVAYQAAPAPPAPAEAIAPPPTAIPVVYNPCSASRGSRAEHMCQAARQKAQVP